MITDRPPRRISHHEEFVRSDEIKDLPLPDNEGLRATAQRIQPAIEGGARGELKNACSAFLAAASTFYKVREPEVSILSVRPLRVREAGWTTELFGDYSPDRMLIRVWMRTAVLKQVTSFGTFFSTLCHEFCHHLDCHRFGFMRTPHTRGFYARAAVLYHHARGTPMRQLIWRRVPGDRWRIDWPAMNRAS